MLDARLFVIPPEHRTRKIPAIKIGGTGIATLNSLMLDSIHKGNQVSAAKLVRINLRKRVLIRSLGRHPSFPRQHSKSRHRSRKQRPISRTKDGRSLKICSKLTRKVLLRIFSVVSARSPMFPPKIKVSNKTTDPFLSITRGATEATLRIVTNTSAYTDKKMQYFRLQSTAWASRSLSGASCTKWTQSSTVKKVEAVFSVKRRQTITKSSVSRCAATVARVASSGTPDKQSLNTVTSF
jgi:hypothetical protein